MPVRSVPSAAWMVTAVPSAPVPESQPSVSVASPVPAQCAAWPRNTRSPAGEHEVAGAAPAALGLGDDAGPDRCGVGGAQLAGAGAVPVPPMLPARATAPNAIPPSVTADCDATCPHRHACCLSLPASPPALSVVPTSADWVNDAPAGGICPCGACFDLAGTPVRCRSLGPHVPASGAPIGHRRRSSCFRPAILAESGPVSPLRRVSPPENLAREGEGRHGRSCMDRKRLLRNPLIWILAAILVYFTFSVLFDDTRGYTQVDTSVAFAQIAERQRHQRAGRGPRAAPAAHPRPARRGQHPDHHAVPGRHQPAGH